MKASYVVWVDNQGHEVFDALQRVLYIMVESHDSLRFQSRCYDGNLC